MKLTDIMDEWSKDAKIDEYALDQDSIKVPELHNKYMKIYTQERLKYRNLLEERKKLKRFKTDYYSGDLNNPEDLKYYNIEPFQKTLTKNKVEQYVDSDQDVININEKIYIIEEKLSYLESVIKSINNRQWNIKNAIDFMKFKNGEM